MMASKPLTPRDYQDAAFPAVCDFFEKHDGFPLVVIPTAGGKSLIMAEFVRRALEIDPKTRFLSISHVSELLSQNGEALSIQCPDLHISYYSDKLRKRDLTGQVVIASIQSVYKKAHLLQSPPPDLLLIDEAHTLPPAGEGMYRRFINDLLMINPKMKVMGYTATPFRSKTGLLHKGDGALFSGIAYEVGIMELVDKGHLCPILTPTMTMRMDVSGVKVAGGDYVQKQLEVALDKDEITKPCVDEMMQYGADRLRWLIFASGIAHSEHICAEINSRGIECKMLTGKTPAAERDAIIAWHKEITGKPRALVNVGVLTTGYNNPLIDLMAFMRPTRSPVLYIQMTGRGMRKSPTKDDCILLDFGGVVETLGPIDQIRLPQKKKGSGDAPTRECPDCEEINHAAARVCINCGYKFPEPKVKIGKQSSSAAVLSSQMVAESKTVTDVRYYRHVKKGGQDTLRVEYYSGLLDVYKRWVPIEHTGNARMMACSWWRENASTAPPKTIDEALGRVDEIMKPKTVKIKKAGRYFEVVGVER